MVRAPDHEHRVGPAAADVDDRTVQPTDAVRGHYDGDVVLAVDSVALARVLDSVGVEAVADLACGHTSNLDPHGHVLGLRRSRPNPEHSAFGLVGEDNDRLSFRHDANSFGGHR